MNRCLSWVEMILTERSLKASPGSTFHKRPGRIKEFPAAAVKKFSPKQNPSPNGLPYYAFLHFFVTAL